MGRMKLSVRDDGLVTADGNASHKQWVCHLTDTDSQYRFDREFLAYEGGDDNGCNGYEKLEDGAILEHVTESADEDKSRLYWRINMDGERATLDRTSAKEAESILR